MQPASGGLRGSGNCIQLQAGKGVAHVGLDREAARQFQQAFSLVILKAPYESRPIEVNALWRKDNGAHPAIAWLKDLLIAESAAI